MTSNDKTDIKVQERNNRLINASVMYACIANVTDIQADLCESERMWAELDALV